MDNIDRLTDLKRELAALKVQIAAWGERLADGDNAVRRELNPAIRREAELRAEIAALEKATGMKDVLRQLMYGPPWKFRDDKGKE